MAAQQPGWAPRLVVPVATAVTVAAVVTLGIYVTGGLITNDARVSMLLTAVWLAMSAAAVALLIRRRRHLAVPAAGAWVVTALGVGGFLLYTSTVDTVVHEQVVTAASAAPSASAPSTSASALPASVAPASPTSTTAPAAPTLVTAGTFRAQAHPTSGRAQVIDLPGGKRVLTLTSFATEPGPDVRVYLVPGDGSSVAKAVDLGGLKGNKGDQQYAVPADAPIGAVVLWCRSFSVAFGAAALHT